MTVKDIRYGLKPMQALDIYAPENPRATYIFIHGGGLQEGDKGDNVELFDYMTAHGIAVISLNYRMMPDAKFPEFIEDCADGVSFSLHRLISEYRLSGNVFLGGSSAGAYISMMLAFDRTYLEKRGIQPEELCGLIFDAGQPTTHYAILQSRGINPLRTLIDETAPLYHIVDAKPGIDVLIINAEHDMPARVEQNALMRRVMINFGYPESKIETRMMMGYEHCGYCGDVKPDGTFAYGEITRRFIEKVCGE